MDTKLKVLPVFPSKTTAGDGIELAKDGPKWTFSLNADFAVAGAVNPTDTILLFNGTNYFRVYLTDII